jgi:hypothetical protein
MGVKVPADIKAKGLEFRKWIGRTLTGINKPDTDEEKKAVEMKAAEFLESVGVHYNVWPNAQSDPDGPKNYAVFDPSRVKIVKVEEIEIEFKKSKKKWVLTSRKVPSLSLCQHHVCSMAEPSKCVLTLSTVHVLVASTSLAQKTSYRSSQPTSRVPRAFTTSVLCSKAASTRRRISSCSTGG